LRILLAAIVALCSATGASEIPTDLLACEPVCLEVQPSSFIFDSQEEFGDWLWWNSPWGRAWVGPIRYVGPIEVSVQARPSHGEVLPLFVGLRFDPGAGQCRSFSAGPTWQTYGTSSCDPGSLWITFPRAELTSVPLDTTYWVQVEGFLTVQPVRASSPYWRCIRVRAYPDALVAKTWGHVKALYRDATR
jgi:hypothetical protein